MFMGFSREEYWSRLPFPTPRDLPYPGIDPKSCTSPAFALGFGKEPSGKTGTTWEAQWTCLNADGEGKSRGEAGGGGKRCNVGQAGPERHPGSQITSPGRN